MVIKTVHKTVAWYTIRKSIWVDCRIDIVKGKRCKEARNRENYPEIIPFIIIRTKFTRDILNSAWHGIYRHILRSAKDLHAFHWYFAGLFLLFARSSLRFSQAIGWLLPYLFTSHNPEIDFNWIGFSCFFFVYYRFFSVPFFLCFLFVFDLLFNCSMCTLRHVCAQYVCAFHTPTQQMFEIWINPCAERVCACVCVNEQQ